MKVLLIGGEGCISEAITHKLKERGYEFTVFDQTPFKPGPYFSQKSTSDTQLASPELRTLVQNQSFDAVIDMVANSTEYAQSLIESLRGQPVHLVVCSTICVYGGPLTQLPTTEDEPHHPVTQYGRSKSKIESIILDANGQNGLHSTILRPGLTIGEGSTLCGLLFDESLPDRLRKGLPVIITDEGRSGMNVAHASDVANAFVNALGREVTFGETYHLSGDEHASWNRIYEAMAEAMGGQCHPYYIPTAWLRTMLPRRSIFAHFVAQWPAYFDCSKAKRDLGYEVTVPLVDTYRRQFEWMHAGGHIKSTQSESFEDTVINTFEAGDEHFIGPIDDSNPWGNGVSL